MIGESARDPHYLALDGARGLAAIAVALFHFREFAPAFHLFGGSFLAVDLFFLMSGLVVARAYEARLRSGSLSFGGFLVTRVLRLYPLYLMACGIGLAGYLAMIANGRPGAPGLGQILAAVPPALLILPMPSDWGRGAWTLVSPAWSLSHELWFNLLFALLLPKLTDRVLIAIALCALVLVAASALHHHTLDLGWTLETAWVGMPRFWFSFAVGVLIHRWQLLPRLPGRLGLLLVPVCFAFVFLPQAAVALQLFWVAVVFPVFVALVARMPLTPVLARLSDHLGRLSYGLYILHYPVIYLVTAQMKADLPPQMLRDQLFVSTVLIVTVLAVTIILTYHVDEPLRRRLSARLMRGSGGQGAGGRDIGTRS